jgi:oxalate decarboxylase/phosphoglucose isomerase-like protein (cupin superfamily)
MTTRHATSLINGEIVEENDLGSIRRVTVDTLPILSGMSIKRIVVNPGAMRTPHWHADCNELTYCVSGTSLVSVLDTSSKFSSFTISAGEMFHIDSGSLHHIENIGDEPAEFILAFRSERPEDFGLAAAFGAMTDAVLGNTYDLPASDFATMRRNTVDQGRRLLHPACLPAPHRGGGRPSIDSRVASLLPSGHTFRDLLRSDHPRRHRLPGIGKRLLARSPRRDVRRTYRRSTRIPVHQGRSAHRDAQQSRRRPCNGRVTRW